MAATQFITAVYDKIWDLLEAHTPFTDVVRVGNRLDWTQGKVVIKRYGMPAKSPADYPEVSLELGDFRGNAIGESHFGMRNPASLGSAAVGTETMTVDYVLSIVTDDKRVTAEQLVFMEMMTALRKGGARWGFSYVMRWGLGYTGTRTVEATDETGQRLRPITRILIPVDFKFNVQDLIT